MLPPLKYNWLRPRKEKVKGITILLCTYRGLYDSQSESPLYERYMSLWTHSSSNKMISGRRGQMGQEPCTISFYILGKKKRQKQPLLTIFSSFAQTQLLRIVMTLKPKFHGLKYVLFNPDTVLIALFLVCELLQILRLDRFGFSSCQHLLPRTSLVSAMGGPEEKLSREWHKQ